MDFAGKDEQEQVVVAVTEPSLVSRLLGEKPVRISFKLAFGQWRSMPSLERCDDETSLELDMAITRHQREEAARLRRKVGL